MVVGVLMVRAWLGLVWVAVHLPQNAPGESERERARNNVCSSGDCERRDLSERALSCAKAEKASAPALPAVIY